MALPSPLLKNQHIRKTTATAGRFFWELDTFASARRLSRVVVSSGGQTSCCLLLGKVFLMLAPSSLSKEELECFVLG